MSRRGLLVCALLLAPIVTSAAQNAPTPVVAKIAATGFASVDSLRIVSALRAGLEADSLFRIVYRPPRDSMSLMAGREFEVARIAVTAEVERIGPRRVLALAATDVVSATSLARVFSELPADGAPAIAAGDSARAFAQALAKLRR